MTGMSSLFLEQLFNNKVCIYSSFTQVLVTYTCACLQRYCYDSGSHLVIIGDANEDTFIVDQLQTRINIDGMFTKQQNTDIVKYSIV